MDFYKNLIDVSFGNRKVHEFYDFVDKLIGW